MKKLLSLFFFSSFLILLLFFLFGGLESELTQLLESQQNKNIYWVLSFGVLASDIFMPVPSSLVMILNGKVLGFLPGTLLSTISGLLSSGVGFYIGRKLEPVSNRFFNNSQKQVSSHMFIRFGHSAIIISKALPVISEAVAFVSGTTSISFKKYLAYSFLGHLIISSVYAYTGSFSQQIDSNLLTGGIIILVLVLFWGADRLLLKKRVQEK